jgi:hypothetical protein
MTNKSHWEDDQLIIDDEDLIELELMDEDELYIKETETVEYSDEAQTEDGMFFNKEEDDQY